MSLGLQSLLRIISEVIRLVYEKLAKIQQELKVGKTQRNTFGGYNFRNCSDILEAVKPLLQKYNCLILLSDTINMVGENNYVTATATIIDCDDSNQMIYNQASAREPECLKGQSPAQITGGSSSYARKYALSGLLAIDDSTDDPDNVDNTKEEERPKPRRSRRTRTITQEDLSNVPF